MLFIMLNPSTADAVENDPTITRCMGFAKREGATHLTVVNLFALRSTDPNGLLRHDSPIGPENDKHILKEVESHKLMPIVAAWGSHKFAVQRALQVCELVGDLWCLGKTKNGSPRHPLYLRNDQELLRLK